MFQLRQVASLPCHDLSSCKVFQEFVLGLDLCTFAYYGIVVLDFSHNCLFWFCHELPKGEIVRDIFYVISKSLDKMHLTCNWVDLI